jgi:uncharacterized membrane protein YphA (DoxX/SURF4 family)
MGTPTSSDNLNQTGQNLVRVLIASYFLAIGVGLIPGTNASPLTSLVLPEHLAVPAGKAVVFVCAYLVLVGIWLRVTALLLATVLFWSSYMANLPQDLEGFWRDLALVGALMLTYTQTLPRALIRRAVLRHIPGVRRVRPGTPVRPRRVTSAPTADGAAPPEPMIAEAPVRPDDPYLPTFLRAGPSFDPSPLSEHDACDNIFREDRELSLAS